MRASPILGMPVAELNVSSATLTLPKAIAEYQGESEVRLASFIYMGYMGCPDS